MQLKVRCNGFKRRKIEGIRLKRIEIDPMRFRNHTATIDLIVVKDPDAPPFVGAFSRDWYKPPLYGEPGWQQSLFSIRGRTGTAHRICMVWLLARANFGKGLSCVEK